MQPTLQHYLLLLFIWHITHFILISIYTIHDESSIFYCIFQAFTCTIKQKWLHVLFIIMPNGLIFSKRYILQIIIFTNTKIVGKYHQIIKKSFHITTTNAILFNVSSFLYKHKRDPLWTTKWDLDRNNLFFIDIALLRSRKYVEKILSSFLPW